MLKAKFRRSFLVSTPLSLCLIGLGLWASTAVHSAPTHAKQNSHQGAPNKSGHTSIFDGPSCEQSLRRQSCYALWKHLRYCTISAEGPVMLAAHGTKTPMTRAFEKEGLFYQEIAQYFDRVDPKAFRERFEKRLAHESQLKRSGPLAGFLANYSKKYRPKGREDLPTPAKWAAMSDTQKLEFFYAAENPFDLMSVSGRAYLFEYSILTFDDIRASDSTPEFLAVGDDLGSYEVRSSGGVEDKVAFEAQRKQVEEALEGRIGHQHVIHLWPQNKKTRQQMAPYYIELLDSVTWFLFWRQAKRNPDDLGEPILFHPYLGVYNRSSLERLHRAVEQGDPKSFKNKFRFVGARALKPLDGKSVEGWVAKPDFELRSGNKGVKRDLVMDTLEARFASGDYSGLQDFRKYDFDASTPLKDLLKAHLSSDDIKTVLAFEKIFPKLKFSPHALALNHYRNKAISPLLPWDRRLPLGAKAAMLPPEQKKFAQALLKTAQRFLKKSKGLKGLDLYDLREEAEAEIIEAVYQFGDRMRIDEDFERYFKPRPSELPSIAVAPRGNIDPNQVDFGIEFSFRFAAEPENRAEADAQLRQAAELLQSRWGGTIEKEDRVGHGHGLGIRYILTLPNGKPWRIEWDGIQRSYRNGKAYWARHGHIEIPTPKDTPQVEQIAELYRGMRSLGFSPKRVAGGAHVNIDVGPLIALGETQGARRMANLVAYFENNQDVMRYLWQHPLRDRAARPIPWTAEFRSALNGFQGNWRDLAKLFYDHRYFNTGVTRKPKYMGLNVTNIMGDVTPESYLKEIDIRHPDQNWFPSFKPAPGRVEFRFPDAPPDEFQAALLVKYMRAVINVALNHQGVLPLHARPPQDLVGAWKENPREFIAAVKTHLRELGLDPSEFEAVIVDAIEQRQNYELKPELFDFPEFKRFKKAREPQSFWLPSLDRFTPASVLQKKFFAA